MAMAPEIPETVAVAIMAKAPIPGLAKTRLISTLGAHAAAVLQERLTERAVETAFAAAIGPVTLWATPDSRHSAFQALAKNFPLALATQPDGDLGARMLAAVTAAKGPALVIGTDCPALSADHLRAAAQALHGHDVVLIPAEDGGYVSIGMGKPHEALFGDISWGTAGVLDETRTKIRAEGLKACEIETLWDVDGADDFARLEREFPDLAL